uniref:Uncharacterized protein n=1 Tax=Junco hyemalis TaxID=40217 RepID=A0A8C5NKL8_JUNHY
QSAERGHGDERGPRVLMGCLTLSLISLPVHLPCCSYQICGVPAQGTLDSHCSQAPVFPIPLMTPASANEFCYVLHHTAEGRTRALLQNFHQLVRKC